jgi:AraC-like DNA-binding protein
MPRPEASPLRSMVFQRPAKAYFREDHFSGGRSAHLSRVARLLLDVGGIDQHHSQHGLLHGKLLIYASSYAQVMMQGALPSSEVRNHICGRFLLTPMTRAMGLGNLPYIVEAASSWSMVERLFERHRLPLAIIDHPLQRIPLAPVIGLFEDAGEALGDRTFGLRVGTQLKHTGFGLWAKYVGSAPTLLAALRRSDRSVHLQQTRARFSLAARGDHTVWRYHRPAGMTESFMHHSDHLLPSMISLVRSYLGEAWIPAWVELEYSAKLNSSTLTQMLQADIKFGQPALGIAICSDHLLAPLVQKPRANTIVSLADVRSSYSCYENPHHSAPIGDVIAMRLLDGKVDLDGAARVLDIGPRTLQRMLKSDNVSYRQLVNEARHKRALYLLTNTSASIGEISTALGFEEFANFTRAFRQWTGAPPSAVRSLVRDRQLGSPLNQHRIGAPE